MSDKAEPTIYDNPHLEELRSRLQVGEDSGDAGPLNMSQIKKEARKSGQAHIYSMKQSKKGNLRLKTLI